MLRFRIRSAILLASAIAIAIAVFVYSCNVAPHSHPLTHAPPRLKLILETHDATVDLRCVSPFYSPNIKDCLVGDQGCRWRMKCNADLIAAHVENFSLDRVSVSIKSKTRMFREFPADWPVLSGSSLDWYAYPYNSGGSNDNYATWYIMAVDNKSKTLYFYWQYFNY